ncbi:MAG: NAD-dependent epimerase/dehydratase family protein [Myxococcales bacterium]|nr:NAD-dependent epimerase/dehydratase family protein [Myxococcales bacterium]
MLERPALVAGASGFVGGHITRLLVERGRAVRVLVRTTSNTEGLAGLPVEVFHGDVLDPPTLHRAMRGCGTVFYCVLDPRFWLSDPTPLYRNNVDGLVNALDAALECSIPRFVFASTMGTLGINPNGAVTEDIAFNWHHRSPPYIRARLQAEERFLSCCRDNGLSGVALCIANTYGPQDYQPTPHGGMLWQVASGKVRWAMDTSAPTVDIRDVAVAALAAEQHGRAGERYIIANEYISYREMYSLAAAACGNPAPRMIPMPLAWAAAGVAERVHRLLGHRDFMARTDAVFLADVFRRLDSSKARRELFWNPRPIEETVRDALAWYAAHAGPSAARANAGREEQ